MPTASKVLVVLILLVALGFLWLSMSVLKARENWHVKVEQKRDQAAALANTVQELRRGTDEARKEFDTLQAEFQTRMGAFLEKKTVQAFQDSVAKLVELARSPSIEETQWEAAKKNYQAAEDELNRAQKELLEAYSAFYGQDAAHPGVRGLASPGPGNEPRLGNETIRDLIKQVQAAIATQATSSSIQRAEGEKTVTYLQDRVNEATAEAKTIEKVAKSAADERDDRIRDAQEHRANLMREKEELAAETKRLEEAIAELNDLTGRFQAAIASNRKLVKDVKEFEIRYDASRGIRTAILTPDGLVPKGKVQQVDREDGILHINLGTRVGVRSGAQLHVYRFAPEAKYLGMLEIIRADSDSATGRMLPQFRQLPIQAGDDVSPEIN